MKTDRTLDGKRYNLLTLAALASIISASAISAKDFFLINSTPFLAKATATWTACPANLFSINPGERFKIEGKDCLLTALRADVHQAGPINQSQQPGTTSANTPKIVTATPYTSDGQSDITEFQLTGPDTNGAYTIGILLAADAGITQGKINESE